MYYDTTPIQIYWKLHHQKLKVSDKNSDIFHISAQNIDCGYSLELPQGIKTIYACCRDGNYGWFTVYISLKR